MALGRVGDVWEMGYEMRREQRVQYLPSPVMTPSISLASSNRGLKDYDIRSVFFTYSLQVNVYLFFFWVFFLVF